MTTVSPIFEDRKRNSRLALIIVPILFTLFFALIVVTACYAGQEQDAIAQAQKPQTECKLQGAGVFPFTWGKTFPVKVNEDFSGYTAGDGKKMIRTIIDTSEVWGNSDEIDKLVDSDRVKISCPMKKGTFEMIVRVRADQ